MAGGGSSGSSKSRPRYAPEDPTLPKPWKALVDGSTGYVYYWNTETNVTQYERPELPPPPPLLPPPPPLPPPKSTVLRSSSAQDHHRDDDDDRYGRSRGHQHGSGRGSSAHSHGHSLKESRDVRMDSRDVRTTSYRGHGSVSDLGGASSAESYRRQHEIIVMGDNIPPPYMTFESTGFPPEILKEVHNAGFSFPTPIQAQSWPVALQSRDIVAIAKTGSGKTLGYLIPGFIHLKRLHNNSKMGPTVLILAPTRELATQIQEEAVKFGRSSRITCTCLYGGAPKGPQLRDLDRGVDIVVATPGRLNDILEMKRISLHQVSYLVLDEADRMLDMGFEPQIRKIVKDIPHHRQTLMFTATWPKEVRNIAADLLVHPVQVNIGSMDELVANNAITQYVEVITPMEKLRRLEQILRSQEPGSKVIVFCSTKRMCDQLARILARQFGAVAIHGDKSQSERDRVLSQFRNGRSPILVATDVAARGLDIKDIRVVLNYDFPTGVEDYVHRIGRTGRAGATGVSYTFFCEQDSKYAADLVKVLEGANQRVPKELRDMVSRGGFGGKSRRWGSLSDARDRGRSHFGHSDSNYNGRGVGALSSLSGRLDTRHGNHGRNDHEPSSGRYGRGNEDNHKVVAQENENRSKGRGYNRSRSRSLSHRHSASPKRGHASQTRSRSRNDGHDRSRSRDRSVSRGVDYGHNRRRSRSRSASRGHGLDRYSGGPGQLTNAGSAISRRTHSPTDRVTSDPGHYQIPYCEEQGTLLHDGPDKANALLDQSPNPHNERSGSQDSFMDNRRQQESGKQGQWHERSLLENGNSRDPVEHLNQSPSLKHRRSFEEEEEGMIPADEDDAALPLEEGRLPREIPALISN